MFPKITAIGFFIFIIFSFLNEPNASEKVYVTDIQRITLRTGPSRENKIISMLSSGQVLEVLEKQGDWSRVRVVEEGEGKKEGWVLDLYLIDRMPYKLQVSSLMEENNRLKANLSPTKRQLEESTSREKTLSRKLQDAEASLRNLKEELETLKKDSSGYLKLKAEYDRVQSKLNDIAQRNEKLRAENRKLEVSERNKWFGTGALVLLCGLILGLMFGRQQRKKSSYY
jgi:SH3 domain protein